MKRLLFFSLFFSFVFLSDAQIRKIPAAVTDAFSARYPHATQVEWRDKLQYFEASFQLNGSGISADFSSKGEWQGSERIMIYDQLTEDVKDGFQKSKYSDWQKNSITELQELGQPLEYRINVQKTGLQKKNLYFDANGKLLKESIAL
jgi:hypothetical protein